MRYHARVWCVRGACVVRASPLPFQVPQPAYDVAARRSVTSRLSRSTVFVGLFAVGAIKITLVGVS